jgi:membrane associated rhomboid family serine protease
MPIFRYYPNHSTGDPELEKKVFRYSLLFPSLIVFIIWLVKLTETTFGLDLSTYGIFPLRLSGLVGILASPLIHGSYEHLFANSVPLFILTFALTYFYRGLAYRIFFLDLLHIRICVWLAEGSRITTGPSGWFWIGFVSLFQRRSAERLKLLTISNHCGFSLWQYVLGIFPFTTDIRGKVICGEPYPDWCWQPGTSHQGPAATCTWEDEPDDLPEENQEDFSGDIQS